jgi:hypothetical protein
VEACVFILLKVSSLPRYKWWRLSIYDLKREEAAFSGCASDLEWGQE